MAGAAQRGGRGELFVQHSTVREDDTLRRLVVHARRDLDMAKALGFRMPEHLAQRQRRIASPALPGNDRIANVSETMRRKRLRPGLPAQTRASAELAIPHPHPISGQAWNGAPVRKHDRLTGRLSI